VVAGERPGEVPFRAHVELLQAFLAHRDEIVEKIQGLLNAQRSPSEFLQDAAGLSRHFEDCFFTLPAITPQQSQLRGQLKDAHWAMGFRPSAMPGMHNDLVDPGTMMVRGFHLWRQTRWPGRSGRAHYAHTLFNAYVIRDLELLSMRVWDGGSSSAGDRLAQIQAVLDRLWESSPAEQPVFVRDARWLIALAQSPTTDELAPYFTVAEHIARTPADEDRLEIYKASVQMAGGHLRSQLRHYCMKKGVALGARNSNALDFSLLIQGLVPLLAAYERACRSEDSDKRLELAGAICQGISADPELFVNRVDLLGVYSMIEYLFIATDHDGNAFYTPTGRRHIQLLQEYAALIARLSKPLGEDCPHFRPVAGRYSAYGIVYGFSSNLTEHMALKALQPDSATRFSLEDVFTEGDADADKLAWVSGWRKLPHIDPQVQRLFDYPQQFAEDIYARIERALRNNVGAEGADADFRTGRVFINSHSSLPADLPPRYIASSDAQSVAAHQAHSCDEGSLLHDRKEGMFLVSYATSGGWVAITKDLLTEVLGTGSDVRIAGLPDAAAAVLRLMCPNLVSDAGSD
jgi:hypothetical protein